MKANVGRLQTKAFDYYLETMMASPLSIAAGLFLTFMLLVPAIAVADSTSADDAIKEAIELLKERETSLESPAEKARTTEAIKRLEGILASKPAVGKSSKPAAKSSAKNVKVNDDGTLTWKGHESLKDETTFTTDWTATKYQIETKGLRLLGEGGISSKFDFMDNSGVVIALNANARNYHVSFCNKKIDLNSPNGGQGGQNIVIAVERRGNKLTYSITGNGKTTQRDTILLNAKEAAQSSRFVLNSSKGWQVNGGEPMLQSITVQGTVKLDDSLLSK